MCILCILIPIIVGLLCALLGYLLGRQIEKKSKVYVKLRADLEKQQSEINSLKNEITILKQKSASLAPAFDVKLAESIFGTTIVENDLKVVEGIGPQIEELFHKAGIKTWKALSETSVEKCQQILEEGGEKFKLHSPQTWPSQAETAYHGLWKVLKWWQDDMIGGRE
jgi:predicted flap endonuclease-1-like 5' DNA nuclease